MINDLGALRQLLHNAQRELAPMVRDDIYETIALRHMVYHRLPALYDELALQHERAFITTEENTAPMGYSAELSEMGYEGDG